MNLKKPIYILILLLLCGLGGMVVLNTKLTRYIKNNVFESFVLAHLEFLRDTFGYKLRATKPGQKARIFAPFRDVWLPRALRRLHAERRGVSIKSVPRTRYLYKCNQTLKKTHAPCMNAIVGWELCKAGDEGGNEGERVKSRT